MALMKTNPSFQEGGRLDNTPNWVDIQTCIITGYQAGKCQCSLDIEATGDKMAGKMMRDDFVTVPARGLREWPLPSAPSEQNEPLCNNIHPHARQLNRD